MNRRLVNAVIALVWLGVLVVPALGATSIEREFRYERGRITLDTHSGRTVVEMDGSTREFTPGQPDLPRVGERVDLPEGYQVASIDVLELVTEPLASAVRLPSTLRLQPGITEEQRTPEDPAAFSAVGFEPRVPVTIGAQGLELGRGVAMLMTAPVRWDASTGQLERVVRMRVRLNLEPAKFPDAVVRERVVPEWESDGGLRLPARAPVASLSAAGGGARPFAATQVPSLLGSPVAYVIITNDDMAAEFQRLADWKTRSGVPAVVRTLSFIRQQYPQGSDDAERVRAFIRDAYSRWGTKWVLLGGDTDVLPTRFARTTFYGGESIACDMYFSCLDGSWNADGDSLYGEGYFAASDPGDNVDLFPEVYVGRAPASTVAQAKTFVDKSLQYVTDPDASGYQNKVLFFGEVLFPQNWLPGMITTLDGAELIEEVLPSLDLNPCVTFVRLYENYLDPRWRPGAMQERRTVVIDSLNAGYNIAVHVGHGYRNVMSVGDDNLTNADAMSLTNGRRLTNLYAIDCTSNAIDFPCLGEAFLHAPNGGAVTNIGSTRFDFPTAGRAYQKEYFRLFYQDSVNAVGELQAKQKLPFIAFSSYDGVNRWTEMTLLLLGDPELRIYSCAPRVLTVAKAASMTLGDSLFTVTVSIAGVPLLNARVTAYKPGADYATALTNGAGVATLVFRPDSAGSFRLTVTGFNCKPFQGDVPVVGTVLPALTDLAPVIDDDNVGGTSGNANGQPDAGEVIDISVPVRNNGGASASTVQGTLSTSDATVTLVTPNRSYGTIGVGATVSPASGFRVSIPYTTADQREVPFRLDLVDSGSRRFVGSFQLTVRAPDLRHMSHAIVDNPGNGNGVPEPGETVSYSVRLRNLGTGVAPGATAVLRSLDGLATITDSTSSWGTLAAGAEIQGDPFVFVPSSAAAKLQLRVSDSYGLMFTQTLDLVRPSTPVSLIADGATTDIELTWARVMDPDLLGYNVYRALAQVGPYNKTNTVPTDRIATYMDQNLAPLTRYYYRVTAMDSSGNESAQSASASASTSPPSHTVFPVPLNRNTPASVAIDHVYTGYPVAIAAGADAIFVFNPDGSAPVDADGAGTTLGDFSTRGKYFAGGPSIADLDGDGIKEFICTTWDSTRAYVFDRDGNVTPGWPVVTGASFSGAAIGDLDGDGKKEVVFATNTTSFFVVRWNGTDFLDGDSNPATIGVFKVLGSGFNYATPAIADLDGNGTKEIVYGEASGLLHAWRTNGTEMPGFPINLHGTISSSAAIGYLDGASDSQLDIVVAAADDSLYAFRADGSIRPGFPKRLGTQGATKIPSPALADMDHDGFLDIVQASTDGRVYVFDRNGIPVTPWVGGVPYSSLTSFASESSPVVADINGDGWEDVLMGGEDVTITAISGIDGTVLAGFPIVLAAEVRGTPAVCDCDGDGKTEIVLSGWDTNLYVWDYDFAFSPGRNPSWPQFHHDAMRSGLFTNPVFVDVGDGPPPPSAAPDAIAFAAPQPNPARGGTRLSYGIPAAAAGERFELAVFDLHGRRVRILAQGIARGGRFSTAWDLSTDDGGHARDGVYFVRFALGAHAQSQKLVVLR